MLPDDPFISNPVEYIEVYGDDDPTISDPTKPGEAYDDSTLTSSTPIMDGITQCQEFLNSLSWSGAFYFEYLSQDFPNAYCKLYDNGTALDESIAIESMTVIGPQLQTL